MHSTLMHFAVLNCTYHDGLKDPTEQAGQQQEVGNAQSLLSMQSKCLTCFAGFAYWLLPSLAIFPHYSNILLFVWVLHLCVLLIWHMEAPRPSTCLAASLHRCSQLVLLWQHLHSPRHCSPTPSIAPYTDYLDCTSKNSHVYLQDLR